MLTRHLLRPAARPCAVLEEKRRPVAMAGVAEGQLTFRIRAVNQNFEQEIILFKILTWKNQLNTDKKYQDTGL